MPTKQSQVKQCRLGVNQNFQALIGLLRIRIALIKLLRIKISIMNIRLISLEITIATEAGMKALIDQGGKWLPQIFFKKKILVYIYALNLAILFYKIIFFPFNNIFNSFQSNVTVTNLLRYKFLLVNYIQLRYKFLLVHI